MGKKSSEYENLGFTGNYSPLPEGVTCLPILKERGAQRVQIGLLPVDVYPISTGLWLKQQGHHVIIDPENHEAFIPKDPDYKTGEGISYGEIVKAIPTVHLYSRS